MSRSPISYIDGVPVKISEKYKPPPKISLPQKIVQCLNHCRADLPPTTAAYDFQREHDALVTISAWHNGRQQERFARRERMRQRQIERQQQHAERQKQMLTAVSYPNAADLSSDEEVDEKVLDNDLPNAQPEAELAEANRATDIGAATTSDAQCINRPPGQETAQPRFDTILMPTIMRRPTKQEGEYLKWSFGSQLVSSETRASMAHSAPTPISGHINWSDFESDTSSPFDNVELKSINDLDILAQVLNLNAASSTDASSTIASNTINSSRGNSQQEVSTQHSQTMSRSIEMSKVPTLTEANQPDQSNASSPAFQQPFNENVLNSNNVAPPTTHALNQSPMGYYASDIGYASNYAYTQSYPASPSNPQQHHIHHHSFHQHTQQQLPQQVFLNYQSTSDPSNVQPMTYHNNIQQRYAGSYAPTHGGPTGVPFTAPQSDTNKPVTGGAPDILMHLKPAVESSQHY